LTHRIQRYIERINANDPTLKKINLKGQLLSDNDLARLIEALNNNQEAAQRIRVLDLSCNSIININALINNLTALIELNLSENNIIEIDVSNLTALLKLDLYYNEITGHLNLSMLINLKFVNVADNKIESIFVTIQHNLVSTKHCIQKGRRAIM